MTLPNRDELYAAGVSGVRDWSQLTDEQSAGLLYLVPWPQRVRALQAMPERRRPAVRALLVEHGVYVEPAYPPEWDAGAGI